MGIASFLRPEDVSDVETFVEFVQQELGTPYPTIKGLAITKKQANKCFNENPILTWSSMCSVVAWAKSRKIRLAEPFKIFSFVKYAFRDGYLPELQRGTVGDEKLESEIRHALDIEDDPEWRRRLINAQSLTSQRKVYEAWRDKRSELLVS